MSTESIDPATPNYQGNVLIQTLSSDQLYPCPVSTPSAVYLLLITLSLSLFLIYRFFTTFGLTDLRCVANELNAPSARSSIDTQHHTKPENQISMSSEEFPMRPIQSKAGRKALLRTFLFISLLLANLLLAAHFGLAFKREYVRCRMHFGSVYPSLDDTYLSQQVNNNYNSQLYSFGYTLDSSTLDIVYASSMLLDFARALWVAGIVLLLSDFAGAAYRRVPSPLAKGLFPKRVGWSVWLGIIYAPLSILAVALLRSLASSNSSPRSLFLVQYFIDAELLILALLALILCLSMVRNYRRSNTINTSQVESFDNVGVPPNLSFNANGDRHLYTMLSKRKAITYFCEITLILSLLLALGALCNLFYYRQFQLQVNDLRLTTYDNGLVVFNKRTLIEPWGVSILYWLSYTTIPLSSWLACMVILPRDDAYLSSRLFLEAWKPMAEYLNTRSSASRQINPIIIEPINQQNLHVPVSAIPVKMSKGKSQPTAVREMQPVKESASSDLVPSSQSYLNSMSTVTQSHLNNFTNQPRNAITQSVPRVSSLADYDITIKPESNRIVNVNPSNRNSVNSNIVSNNIINSVSNKVNERRRSTLTESDRVLSDAAYYSMEYDETSTEGRDQSRKSSEDTEDEDESKEIRVNPISNMREVNQPQQHVNMLSISQSDQMASQHSTTSYDTQIPIYITTSTYQSRQLDDPSLARGYVERGRITEEELFSEDFTSPETKALQELEDNEVKIVQDASQISPTSSAESRRKRVRSYIDSVYRAAADQSHEINLEPRNTDHITSDSLMTTTSESVVLNIPTVFSPFPSTMPTNSVRDVTSTDTDRYSNDHNRTSSEYETTSNKKIAKLDIGLNSRMSKDIVPPSPIQSNPTIMIQRESSKSTRSIKSNKSDGINKSSKGDNSLKNRSPSVKSDNSPSIPVSPRFLGAYLSSPGLTASLDNTRRNSRADTFATSPKQASPRI